MFRNIAENFNRLSRAHERYRQTTDDRPGRTHRITQQECNVARNFKAAPAAQSGLLWSEADHCGHANLTVAYQEY